MSNVKYIKFKASWWHILRTLSDELRDEVFRGICVYAFEGQEPELSGMAAGIFATIRVELDKDIAHDEQVRAARSKAGRVRAARTNEIRWGSRQISSNDDKCHQMTTNDDNSSSYDDKTNKKQPLLSSNDDKCHQMTTTPPVPPTMQNNIYNYILTHSHNAHAQGFEVVLGWLTDDTERLRLQFHRLGLLTNQDGDEAAAIIQPYVDAYFEANDFAADWERKGRRDTKAHFSSWVRTHKNLEENGTTRPTAGKSRTTAGEAYDAIAVGIAIAEADRAADDIK